MNLCELGESFVLLLSILELGEYAGGHCWEGIRLDSV